MLSSCTGVGSQHWKEALHSRQQCWNLGQFCMTHQSLLDEGGRPRLWTNQRIGDPHRCCNRCQFCSCHYQ